MAYASNTIAPGIYLFNRAIIQELSGIRDDDLSWGCMEETGLMRSVLLGKNLGDYGKFLCMHNILKAHARIYHIYDTEFRKQQNGQIGLVAPCEGAFAKTPNDTAAVDLDFQFTCGWATHPIFSETGDYPEVMKTRIAENSKLNGLPRSVLPEFSPEWVQYIK